MSRKLDKSPVIHKNCAGCVSPSSEPRALRIRSAGIIVMNIPMNSMATSCIASHVKLLALRTFLLVVLNERKAAASMITISMIAAHESVTPSQKLIPFANAGNFIGRTPLRITAPTIITRNIML